MHAARLYAMSGKERNRKMNAALEWIKAYVPDLECTDQEFMDKMTLSGTKCEGYERMDKILEKIVIGQIYLQKARLSWKPIARAIPTM